MVAKKKTRREQLEALVGKIADIAATCDHEVALANEARDAALAEAKTREIESDLRGEPITAEALTTFLDYVEKRLHWRARFGRLTFWCCVDGSWGLAFDSTYGGSIGSYRKLKTITEVKLLVELLGVMTYEQLRAREKY